MTNLASETSKSEQPGVITQTGPETASCEWLKTSDGTAQFVRHWEGHGRGPVVIYLHGIEGHGRWIEETAIELATRGITTYTPDRRGAGRSKELRGHVNTYKLFVSDVNEVIDVVASRHPSEPIFIMANCWGGKVGLCAAAEQQKNHPGRIGGIVLTSPAVSVQVDVPIAEKVRLGFDYVFGKGQALFDIPLTPEHFTDNKPYLDYIAADPLRLTQVTGSFFIESLRLTRACRLSSKDLEMPMLILQPGRDRIVNIDKIHGWFAGLKSKDKILKIFETSMHSLDFEPDPSEYRDLLSSWLLEKSERP